MSEVREAAAPSPIAERTIPLVSLRRKRAQLVQKFQHAIPAVALLIAGAQGIMHGERGFALALAVGELAVSALLLRALGKELAAVRRPHHAHAHQEHGIEWFDVFAAGVLTVEALEHWHVHHHLPRPTLLTAAVTLVLGLFHGRIAARLARRRVLHIDAAGIRVRSRFRQFFAPWSDIERIDLEGRTARIVARGGRERRIDLADLPNGPEVREALQEAGGRLAASAL